VIPKIVFEIDAEPPAEPGAYVLTGRWDFSGRQPVFAVDRVDAQQSGQRQDSVTDQLQDLVVIAERQHGMYDAADWIRRMLSLAAEARAAQRLFGSVTGRTTSDSPHVEEVASCLGCGRPYSVRGFINGTEIGCREAYASTGETPAPAWCVELQRYV
jgi:hypothetical protein